MDGSLISLPPSVRSLGVTCDGHHRYWVGHRQLAGVTTVLEEVGLYSNPWARDVHRERGTAVHQITSAIDRGDWDYRQCDDELRNYGNAYWEWKQAVGFQALADEKIVASISYSLAGRLDRYGYLQDGTRVIVDIKSGQPSPAAGIQTALYQFMLGETSLLETGEEWPVDERIILWLKPSGEYIPVVRHAATYPTDLQVGLSAVQIYHWRKDNLK